MGSISEAFDALLDGDPRELEEFVGAPGVRMLGRGGGSPHGAEFDPSAHPRDRVGKFVEILHRMGHRSNMQFGVGALTTVRGSRVSVVRVRSGVGLLPTHHYEVHSPDRKKGIKVRSVEHAARKALDEHDRIVAKRTQESVVWDDVLGDDPLGLEERRHEFGIHFDPSLHPRDREGQFAEVLGRLTHPTEVTLPHGLTVRKGRVAGFTVHHRDGTKFSLDHRQTARQALTMHDNLERGSRAFARASPGGGRRHVGKLSRLAPGETFRQGSVAVTRTPEGFTVRSRDEHVADVSSPEDAAGIVSDVFQGRQRQSPGGTFNVDSSRERGLAQIDSERRTDRPRIAPWDVPNTPEQIARDRRDRARSAVGAPTASSERRVRSRSSKAQALVDAGLASDLADARAQLADMGERGSPGGARAEPKFGHFSMEDRGAVHAALQRQERGRITAGPVGAPNQHGVYMNRVTAGQIAAAKGRANRRFFQIERDTLNGKPLHRALIDHGLANDVPEVRSILSNVPGREFPSRSVDFLPKASPGGTSREYEAAVAKHNDAVRVWREAQQTYRERKDTNFDSATETYLAARRRFEAATAEFDAAFARERDGRGKASPGGERPERIPRDQYVDRLHMTRIWPERENPLQRHSIRDNVRAQRSAKRYAANNPDTVVWADTFGGKASPGGERTIDLGGGLKMSADARDALVHRAYEIGPEATADEYIAQMKPKWGADWDTIRGRLITQLGQLPADRDKGIALLGKPGGPKLRGNVVVHEGDRLDGLRTVVGQHSARVIDGHIVDPTTAGLLLQVHDSLSPANKSKFHTLPLARLVDFAWSRAA